MKSNTEVVYPTPGYSFCFQMTMDRKLHYNWHHHIEYEFTVCRNGSGEANIGDVIHSFKSPAAFFIAPLTDHAFISKGQFDGWIIQIPPLILDHYKVRPECRFLADLIHRASPALGFSEQTSKRIVKILEKAQDQEGVYRWICLLDAFFITSQDRRPRLFSFQPEHITINDLSLPRYSGTPNKNRGDTLDEIIDFLFNKFADSHRLEDLAKSAGMPPQSFCRHFKKRTGMTVVEYLHSVRINMAKKLLQQSKFYVDDICYETGFNSVSFFNRKFKEVTGMTPMEYRRNFGGYY
jgi:AraC-like DNA-binding protein